MGSATLISPADWRRAQLREVAKFSSGTTPLRARHVDFFSDGKHLWVKTLDLNNSIVSSTDESVTDLALEETSLKVHPAGTVLVAMYGGFKQIGRTGLLDKPATVNQAITAVLLTDSVLVPEFLLYTLNYRVGYWRSVASSSRKDPNITSGDVKDFPIAFPDAGEQSRIAAAIRDADGLIGALERLIEKKQAIKQGMMQQLLTGKTRLPGFTAPWAEVKLGEVANFSKGMGLAKSDLSASGTIPCVHYGELFTKYGAEIRSVHSRTCLDSLPVRSESLDVLMPTSDVTPRGLAKASSIHLSDVALGGDVLIIRPDKSKLYGPFLAHFIRLDTSQVLRLVKGSTVFHLYGTDMRGFELAIPNLDEQRAVCSVLSDAEAELHVLEARLAKAKAIKQGMMQELLTGRTRLPVEEGASA